MEPLFKIKKTDRDFYDRNIRDFLPEKIIDAHTHIWRGAGGKKTRRSKAVQSWPSLVADRNPVTHLLESYRLMLPGKKVTPVVFNTPSLEADTDRLNRYAALSAGKRGFPALMLSRPEWSGREFLAKLSAGKFAGAKPYLSFAPGYIPTDEIRIFDFMPVHQLEVLNDRGLILMLHIPRPGRLKDPVNLEQMMEIDRSFPRLKLIIAHVGRAYCPSDTGGAFKTLEQARSMMFDISANTNEAVFRQLIESAGPDRILFGSDLPIARMRMRRVCRKGVYVNIVPPGLYGDVSGHKHMEEAEASEAGTLTFFLYEQINAFRKAAARAGLGREDIKKVFFRNAEGLLKEAVLPGEQLRMELPPEKMKRHPLPLKLHPEYAIRTFTENDGAKYLDLMRKAGFAGWNSLASSVNLALPRGIFFAVHKRTGELAGTCSAFHDPDKSPPSRGGLGWLGVHPSHRGRGLGETLCRAVINRFREAGYTGVYLSTDDFRLPAIKTYLKLGFSPVILSPEMEKRWEKVFKELDIKPGGVIRCRAR